MKKFNILYYSNAFVSSHGGRLHSEAFLQEAKKNERIGTVVPYPKPSKAENAQSSKDSFFRRNLKKNGILQIIFFYRRNRNSYRDIVKELNRSKERIDVLHIRVDSNFLIIPKIKKEFPNLIITTEINASPFDENFSNIAFINYFRKVEKKMFEKADANFFVSGFLKNKIIKVPKETRDFVVHNGVDLEIFQPKQFTETNIEVVFGYVGTIDYHKNLKQLIDAFVNISHNYKEKVSLLIIGDGPMMNELRSYIKLKGVGAQIKLAGWVTHTEIVNYLHKMDVAIHHSANPYMSPLKIFEYMAVGLPVIGPDIPAVREIFENEKEILMVENREEDLISKMKYVLNNNGEAAKLALAGCEKVRNYYGWEHNAKRILMVMQDKLQEIKN